MSPAHRITVDTTQCGGQPCLRGLRIRVKAVLDLLAAGADRDEILVDHPLLEAGDIGRRLGSAPGYGGNPAILHWFKTIFPDILAALECGETLLK
jgi:uncharacterized protein (DUF433 family)